MENCLLRIMPSITRVKEIAYKDYSLASDHESVTLVPVRKAMNMYHILEWHVSPLLCFRVTPFLAQERQLLKHSVFLQFKSVCRLVRNLVATVEIVSVIHDNPEVSSIFLHYCW